MSNTITPDQAAEMFKLATTSASKWKFLDGVADMVKASPGATQKDIVDQIGDTPVFIGMHGHFRDDTKDPSGKRLGSKATSKLKSIRDELSTVKVWEPAARVDGVSFESHKILNRLGSAAGNKILNKLVVDMGGPGNVTKAAVAKRLKMADPDHIPQANGKKPAAPAAGNQPVTSTTSAMDMSPIALAEALLSKLNVGELSKDQDLAQRVEAIADVYEAFSQRKAAKASNAGARKVAPKKTAAKKKAAGRKKLAANQRPSAAPVVKRPSRPSVKAPSLKAKASA